MGFWKIEAQTSHFWRIFNRFCEKYAHRIFYGPRDFKLISIFKEHFESKIMSRSSHRCIFAWCKLISRYFKNNVKIWHFWRIFRIFCEKYARRIFYESQNFKIRFFWKNLNLTTIYDFFILYFVIDIFAFKDALKTPPFFKVSLAKNHSRIAKYTHF